MNGRRRLDRKSGSGGRTGTGNRVVNIGNSRCQRDFSKQGNARLAPPPPSFFHPDRSLELLLYEWFRREMKMSRSRFFLPRGNRRLKATPAISGKIEDRVLEIRVAYVSGNIGEWLGRWVS